MGLWLILPEQGSYIPAKSPESLLVIALIIAPDSRLAIHDDETRAVKEWLARGPMMGQRGSWLEQGPRGRPQEACDQIGAAVSLLGRAALMCLWAT